jgi:nitronate monooxygenase
MGAMGALTSDPAAIAAWAATFRAHSNGAFQLNLWIPDAPTTRDPAAEARVRALLSRFAGEDDEGRHPIHSP